MLNFGVVIPVFMIKKLKNDLMKQEIELRESVQKTSRKVRFSIILQNQMQIDFRFVI